MSRTAVISLRQPNAYPARPSRRLRMEERPGASTHGFSEGEREPISLVDPLRRLTKAHGFEQ
jgi:hypothetical protein